MTNRDLFPGEQLVRFDGYALDEGAIATSEVLDLETPAFPREQTVPPRKARIGGPELIRGVATDRDLPVEKREVRVFQWSLDTPDSRMHGSYRVRLV
jgi:hypothetical protein